MLNSLQEYCADFLHQLVDWIKKCSFAKTILLTSLYNYERIDSQLIGSPFRYTVTSATKSAVEDELKYKTLSFYFNPNW